MVLRLLAVLVVLGPIAACSHIPAERSPSDVTNSTVRELKDKGVVRFSIHSPEADGVTLVLMRTFVASPVTFEAQASQRPDGTWTAELDLMPGDYRYFFVVDGSVTVEKGRGRVEQDDFGGVTGVLSVHRTPEGALRIF
ncbi:MAG: hypothetical protein RRA15_06350 [bacterium]|nr:hypothetical protein [bacterium]MDT8366096.1 hypothetical protein [bacterium]